MEGLIVAAVIALAGGAIFGIVVHIINYFFKQEATEGDKVKFYELDNKVEGIIVKDNGTSVEVEYWYFDKGIAIKQIAVVNRVDIFKY